MKRAFFCGAMILGLFSCTDNGTKDAMQKDSVVNVNPPPSDAGRTDTMNSGSTINGGTNSSGSTNMNSSGTTTTDSDTSKRRNDR